MAMRFGEDYRETATLRDGRRVTLRCVRPSDKDLLRRGFERLSPESRYRRFLATKRSLTDRELVYLTEVDGFDHFAIGATATEADGSECGVGIARFVRSREDPEAAEPAIAVADDWQRDGLGTLLLHRLVSAARERGVERFQSLALAGNAALLEVLDPLGAGVEVERHDGELSIRVPLPVVPKELPPMMPPERKPPLERVLELAGKGLLGMATWLGGRHHTTPEAAEEAEPEADRGP